MGVGTQVIIIMFDDNKITVTAQCVTGIDNASVCGRDDCCPLLPAISIPLLPLRGSEVLDDLAVSWPTPVVIDELAF